jgi:hypothetical protein
MAGLVQTRAYQRIVSQLARRAPGAVFQRNLAHASTAARGAAAPVTETFENDVDELTFLVR